MGAVGSRVRKVGVAALAVTALAAIAVPAASGITKAVPRGSWPYPNANLANTRVAAGSTITSHNVAKLRQAWSFMLSGKALKSVSGTGSLVAGPVVVDGVVFVQDLHSNVYALSLATGHLDWEYWVNKPVKSGPGPNGVAVVNGLVYGATPTTVFALHAATGKIAWVDRHLLGPHQGTFGIQPEVANGRVYLAGQYGLARGGGLIMALDAATGAREWSFKTVPGNQPNVTSVGLGAGGAWETPLVSPDGSVAFGTGNPYQTIGSAFSSPSKLLYSDSVVDLDAATGRLRWYYQGVPNDYKDYDLQASPIATSVAGKPVVLGAGKMGIVYEMSATTGRLLWKTPVGVHDGHDDDSLRALEHRKTPSLPYTYEPGSLGGVLTNMAEANGTVYVATCNVAFNFAKLSEVIGTTTSHPTVTGDIEALSVATGKVEWDRTVNDLPLGAMTVSNDLVFATLLKGKLIALNRTTGAIVFSLQLPRSTNASIAVAGNTVLVPAGGPKYGKANGPAQILAYTVP